MGSDLSWLKGFQPGKDWTHRIDAIPQPWRRLKFRLASGLELAGQAVPAAGDELKFTGIGCEVAYLCGGLRYRADQITHWRYAV